MIDYIEKAKAFAMMAHKGQTDKAGKDYFTAHVAVVADGVEPDPLVKAAAYLHDTVEDTGTTIDTIRAEFPQEVAFGSYKVLAPLDMQRTDYEQRLRDALETLCFFEAAPMCDILGTLLYWTPAPAESKS